MYIEQWRANLEALILNQLEFLDPKQLDSTQDVTKLRRRSLSRSLLSITYQKIVKKCHPAHLKHLNQRIFGVFLHQ